KGSLSTIHHPKIGIQFHKSNGAAHPQSDREREERRREQIYKAGERESRMLELDLCVYALVLTVQNLLQQMNEVPCFFNYYALDEMGSRITELEQSINDLRTEMGAEGSPSPLAPSKKPDDTTPEEGSA
ncbi:hypothetical protein RJ639_000476, partial [Escallonia herrerae]